MDPETRHAPPPAYPPLAPQSFKTHKSPPHTHLTLTTRVVDRVILPWPGYRIAFSLDTAGEWGVWGRCCARARFRGHAGTRQATHRGGAVEGRSSRKMDELSGSWNPFRWQPATLYFRTQDEAYSYGDRPPSGWNPVVGESGPLPSLPLDCDSCQSSADCLTDRRAITGTEKLLQQLEVRPPARVPWLCCTDSGGVRRCHCYGIALARPWAAVRRGRAAPRQRKAPSSATPA